MYLENDTLIGSGFVFSLFAQGGKLYVGGDFDLAGEIQSKGVATWNIDSGTWDSMYGGLSGTYPGEGVYAYDFAAIGQKIYVGGKFDYAGESKAKNIAQWDSSGWTAIGNAQGGYVFDLEPDTSGNLYSTGYYASNDENGASGIGKWDGSQWTSIAAPEGVSTYVKSLKAYKGGLFAAGNFENDTLRPGIGLAFWDGLSWTFLRGLGQAGNEFLPGGVSGMEIINGRLFVAGNFTKSGSTYGVNVAEWDIRESSWRLLNDGSGNQGIHDGWIHALAENGDSVYAGGSFSVAGGVYARNIARWTGRKWETVGVNNENGIRGSVYCILLDNNVLYAGGYFGSAGSTSAFHIARWDGKKWAPVGIGVGGVSGSYVSALAKIGNYLYVGGYFSVVGDEENYELPANSIARFDLTTDRWETLGRGIEYVYGIPGKVDALTAVGNTLYVGGEFHSADDRNYDNFAVLENNKWAGIDGFENIGIEGRVKTIKVLDSGLYIGGQLKPDREGKTYGILKWEDKKWIPVDDQPTIEGEDVMIYDIEAYGNGFIAGGRFSTAGNKEVNNLAWFDGREWNDIGGGIWPGVGQMSLAGNRLFLAGPREIYVSGLPCASLAEYSFNIPTESIEIPSANETPGLGSYPNPFKGKTVIWYKVSTPGRVRLSLYDARGREITGLFDGYRNPGMYDVEFNKDNLPAGVYFCRLAQGYRSVAHRIVILE